MAARNFGRPPISGSVRAGVGDDLVGDRRKQSAGEDAPLSLYFLSPRVGFAVPDANDGPLWWTRDGGKIWQPITITAGPFTVPP
jgi:hypothetical protein